MYIKRNFLKKYLFQVVCAKCSGQKHPMAFEDNKVLRVCRSCHQVITLRNESESNENKPMMSKDTMDLPVRPKGLLEVNLI